ncbi:threonine ammonia-lyase [Oceanobacillus indicireducens]|uniref:L-threonine dehydratase catabolic TdcB n=1 Tax=Oceanobacillus indicireducens TaxID=1004261 RepID=A0A917XS96_9BACI|nr:threonine ammonia-lyase [Oceanobacillus indicireducens]GGN51468.1 threonine ammonia-lyase [Oceanobacillus indicireducens]
MAFFGDLVGDLLTGEKIYQAWKRLAPIVHRTPLLTSHTIDDMVGRKVYCKMENQQKTGAFKFRGATFKLMQLTKEELQRGVITASAGNHAQGVAYAARKLGANAKIFMPEGTPLAKVHATRNYGADVVLTGESFQEAYQASMEYEKESGSVYVHPFDDYDVMTGQGTIAMELLRQEDRIDTVFVPIGGGGLIAGIAVACKHINRNIQVIGVQASGADAMYQSYHSKQMRHSTEVNTLADGIAVKEPGKSTFPIIRDYVDDVVTVTDEQIAASILFMLERNKTLTEGAGATALAGLFAYHKEIPSRHTGVIVSGGNFDIKRMAEIQDLAEGFFPVEVRKKEQMAY